MVWGLSTNCVVNVWAGTHDTCGIRKGNSLESLMLFVATFCDKIG